MITDSGVIRSNTRISSRREWRLMPFAVAFRMDISRGLRTLGPLHVAGAVSMSTVETVAIVVGYLGRLVFLYLFYVPIAVAQRVIHVTGLADDWAELDVVHLRDPAPAMTAGLERRDFLKALASGRSQ